MHRRVLKFVDALLDYFSADDRYFERVLYLRHEIRRAGVKSSDGASTAADILNTFSANSMPKTVEDVVDAVTEEKMKKWVTFILGDQKSPAYTDPSSSNASSSSYSGSSSSISSASSTMSPSSSSSSMSAYSASSKSN